MIFKFYRASFFVGMIGKKPSQESLDCQKVDWEVLVGF